MVDSIAEPQNKHRPPAISIRNLAKNYDSVQALRGIDLDVQDGDFFALLGANGAGKSTVIGIIASLVIPTSGSVEVFGRDLKAHRSRVMHDVGIVNQEFNFNMFERVDHIVATQGGYFGLPPKEAMSEAERVLELVGLSDKLRDTARMLSGGMKRRLMLARALIHKPRLLILDEPTAGVDIAIRHQLWDLMELLNAQGITIVLTTHYLEEAEHLCRQLAIIDHGSIVETGDVRTILGTLNKQVFVAELEGNQKEALEGFHYDSQGRLRLEVDDETGLSDVFAQISAAGLRVASLRPETNRLEQYFLDKVNGTSP